MKYCELRPTDRDDLSSQFVDRFCEYMKSELILVNSGTGSGKSRIMRQIPQLLKNDTITYVLSPDELLRDQLYKVFAADESIYLVDGNSASAQFNIQEHIGSSRIVVFFSNIGHRIGSFKKSTTQLVHLLRQFREYKAVVLIDELHKVLTSLTGGLNPTINHATTQLCVYSSIMKQHTVSLNLFDVFRSVSAKVFGFSATLNHIICSKLHIMGYPFKTICCVNVYPIPELYSGLKCIGVDTTKFSEIYPYMVDAEKILTKKILVIFPSEESILKWVVDYSRKSGRTPSYVKITAQSPIPTMAQLKDAQYILGINIVSTGYDISTHITDQEFSLGILIREFSDKSSQPLSANPYHHLHMEESAHLLQSLGRLRTGGIFLVPIQYNGIDLHGLHLKIADRIRDGYKECMTFGEPVSNQIERYHQANLVGLWQNIREHNQRPVVEEILNDMQIIEGCTVFDRIHKCNVYHWISVMKCIWDCYILQDNKKLSHEEKVKHVHKLCLEHYRNSRTTGGGMRTVRLTDDEVREAVSIRSEGKCAHCGDIVDNPAEGQYSHIQRHDNGGPFTVDNIVFTHRGCDGCFDDAGLLHDPAGGYWKLRRLCGYNPDMKQIASCSHSYICARWSWAQRHKGVESYINFRVWLHEHGYLYST